VKPRPPGDQHPDGPKEPDQPDEPDPDDDKKPDPDEEKKERCSYLREALIAATHNLDAAEKRFEEANEKYDQKVTEANKKWGVVVKLVSAAGIEFLVALWELRKGQIPRGIILPSDLARAVRDYNEAMREADEALNSRNAREKERDERLAEKKEIEEEMKRLGC
jgi:hypothetical protein